MLKELIEEFGRDVMSHLFTIRPRPKTPLKAFEKALKQANLSKSEEELIEYIRYTGCFTQVSLTQALKLRTKPPALSILCRICSKIGANFPEHFAAVRQWSMEVNEYGISWDGDLICSTALNIDGKRLTPEAGTTQYHTFVVHQELFQGLN